MKKFIFANLNSLSSSSYAWIRDSSGGEKATGLRVRDR